MTPLEYRGHALETLLAGDSITTPPWFVRLGFSLLMALFGYCIGRTFRMRWTIVIAVVAITAFGGAAWILLLWQQLWIPCAPLAASLVFAGLIASFMRVQLQQIELRRSRTSQLASDLALTFQSKCSWRDVTNLISHFVDWDRMVLMELPSGLDHLQVVVTDGCDDSDIFEKRRDIMRMPYSSAKNSGDVLELSERAFLHPRDGETQLLVPFLTNGEVVAFMTVGVADEKISSDPQLLSRLSQVAPDIAELISRKQSNSMNQAQKSGAKGDDQFQSVDAAVAVCDLFGRIEMMNAEMIDLCSRRFFDAGYQSLTDLLALLLDGGRLEAREMVATVVMESESVVRRVKSSRPGVTRFMQLSPILQPADPFGVEVMCLAVFESTEHSAHISKEDLAERAVQPMLQNAARVWTRSMKEPIDSIKVNIAAGNPGVREPSRSEDWSTESGRVISSEADVEMQSVVESRNEAVVQAGAGTIVDLTEPAGESSSVSNNGSPPDSVLLLGRSLLARVNQLQKRQIIVELSPNACSAVTSVPEETQKNVFQVVARLLLAHSRNGSTIKIEADDCVQYVEIFIQSIPASSSDESVVVGSLEEDSCDLPTAWKNLRGIQAELTRHDCRLQVSSRQGTVSVSLVMPLKSIEQTKTLPPTADLIQPMKSPSQDSSEVL